MPLLPGPAQLAAPAVPTYRKTTAKVVNTTVGATDLLNGEITIAAGQMGATGLLRLTAFGDFINNSGGPVAGPRFQLLLGGTTLLDTNALTAFTASAGRFGWNLTAEILNLSASSQVASMDRRMYAGSGLVAAQTTWTTGEGGGTTTSNSALDWGVNSGLSVNTAVACALVLNTINGSANAAYETKLLGALVEII